MILILEIRCIEDRAENVNLAMPSEIVSRPLDAHALAGCLQCHGAVCKDDVDFKDYSSKGSERATESQLDEGHSHRSARRPALWL
jgi:hypothetical protein